MGENFDEDLCKGSGQTGLSALPLPTRVFLSWVLLCSSVWLPKNR